MLKLQAPLLPKREAEVIFIFYKMAQRCVSFHLLEDCVLDDKLHLFL